MSCLLLHLLDRARASRSQTTCGWFGSLALEQGEQQQSEAAAATIKRGRERAAEHRVAAQRVNVARRASDERGGEEGKSSLAKHRQEVAGQQAAQLQQQREHQVLQHASEAGRKSSDKVGKLCFSVRLLEAKQQ